MRTIKRKFKAEKVNMGGIILDQALPLNGIDQIDPFLLIHHWKSTMKGNQKQQEVGVGPHPHRGFAPVTFIFEGSLQHRDSAGHNSIVHKGGTQWMNSGKGIIHSERPTKELAAQGGEFEIIQFWVNAPKARKLDEPNYQPLSYEEMPKFTSKDGKIVVGVVAGTVSETQGIIDTYSPLLALRLDIEKGGTINLPIPKNYNAFLYQLDGKTTVNGETASNKDLVWFNNDGDSVSIEGLETGKAIVLAGEPINEPLATYGPFVMNSESEIVAAIQDYQAGKMGVLREVFE